MPPQKKTATKPEEQTARERNADRYTVDGKTFRWTTDDGEVVVLPLRIKLKVFRSLDIDQDVLDAEGMFKTLEAFAPGRADELDEMDLNDFQAMFVTWQEIYGSLSGAGLGE